MEPIPSPSISVDPLNPLPADIPPAPDWLLPVALGLFIVVAMAITVLLIMWGISRRKSAAVLASGREKTSTWVDLRDFDPKADPRRPKSPKVVRDDPRKPKKMS